MYINGKSIGDGWIMESIEQEVLNARTVAGKTAELVTNSVWKSPSFKNGEPFFKAQTTVTVHPLQNDFRKIDFKISMIALVPNFTLGGSNDEKGYGGFCARFKIPEDLSFISNNKSITPHELQIEAGPWMDFSASFGKNDEINGIAILCHPNTPNFPAPWILRAKTSMQNIVFPGRYPVEIPTDKPVTLYYRMIIHNGREESINLDELQDEYAKKKVSQKK